MDKKSNKNDEIKKILVVRFRQIGDAILASVLCNTLKKSFPNAQVDYVLYDFVAPLFENHPYIDNVVEITHEQKQNLFKYVARVREITKQNYDIVIDIMSTPKSELFCYMSPKTKFRIGRWGSKRKPLRGFRYTHGIYEPTDAKDKCDKFLKMLKPLEDAGYNIFYDDNIVIGITPEEKKMMRERMEAAGVDFSKRVFACAINSRRPNKVYPIENMKKLINMVLEKYPDVQIVFYYSPAEREFAIRTHEELGNNPRIFTNILTKSIRELAMLIANCDFFFGNEGGPRHLAQGVGVPNFSLWRPEGDKAGWLPAGRPDNVGLEPKDLGVENYSELTFEERYNLMTPEIIMGEIENMVERFVRKVD